MPTWRNSEIWVSGFPAMTTEPGDVILSDGNLLVLYYAPNTWRFTRLGKVQACSPEELRALLGSGNITATLRIDEN